jgi:hypothetical protein
MQIFFHPILDYHIYHKYCVDETFILIIWDINNFAVISTELVISF